MSWSFGPIQLVEVPGSCSFVLAATTVVRLLFDGTLPRDKTTACVLRYGYRVLGSFVLERVENVGRPEAVRLVMRLVEPAAQEQQPLGPLDLAVIAAHSWGALCVDRSTGETVRVSGSGARELVCGDCMRFYVRNSWKRGKTTFVSGEYDEPAVNIEAFGLPPLRVTELGVWDPQSEQWETDARDAPAAWTAIKQRGARPQFRMEAVLPCAGPGGTFQDPLRDAVEAHDKRERTRARDILRRLLENDVRCLDAHALQGDFSFDRKPKLAVRQYLVGVEFGRRALGADFNGVLRWDVVENQPFLRCLFGYALCLWRLDRQREAADVIEQLVWLNPADQQGARFVQRALKRGLRWSPNLEM
jgi:hypothetical protein